MSSNLNVDMIMPESEDGAPEAGHQGSKLETSWQRAQISPEWLESCEEAGDFRKKSEGKAGYYKS